MDLLVKTKDKRKQNYKEEIQLYSVEDVFDRIDNKFIDFYGEYGRKIVNTRRNEWNQDNIAKFKIL